MADTEARPLRMCDSCGGVDDHPRHVYALGPDQNPTSDEVASKALDNAVGEDRLTILKQIRDVFTQQKHLDCCRADGCPDGTCYQVTAGAEDLRGMELVAHLTKPQED